MITLKNVNNIDYLIRHDTKQKQKLFKTHLDRAAVHFVGDNGVGPIVRQHFERAVEPHPCQRAVGQVSADLPIVVADIGDYNALDHHHLLASWGDTSVGADCMDRPVVDIEILL